MDFCYQDERFADLQLLRYRLNGFDKLSLNQKVLIYYLSKATLFGRDITFDQFGKYNLRIRKMLEVIYCDQTIPRDSDEFKAFEVYLKRMWFSSGIYHHYGCEKFKPAFPSAWLRQQLEQVDAVKLPLREGETVDQLCEELFPVIFDETVLPKRVNKADGEDLLLTSACHFYDGVTQEEAEAFYNQLKQENADSPTPVSYGLNSTLVKEDGEVREQVWSANGKYANAIRHIIYWLEKAETVVENDQQKKVIRLLINYYESGDLQIFNKYCIEWLQEHDSAIDFINGFIEVYGDPLGLKGSWEGLVEYIDEEEMAKRRNTLIKPYEKLVDRPLYRIRVFQTERYVYAFMDFCHLFNDGMSVRILMRNLSDAYNGKALPHDYAYLFADETNRLPASAPYEEARRQMLEKYGKNDWCRRFTPDDPSYNVSCAAICRPLATFTKLLRLSAQS